MSKLTLEQLLASARADDPTALQLGSLETKLAHLFVVPPGGGPAPSGSDGGGTTGGTGAGSAGTAGNAAKGASVAASLKKGAVLKWLAAVLAVGGAGVGIQQLVTRDNAPSVAALPQATATPDATVAATLITPDAPPQPAAEPLEAETKPAGSRRPQRGSSAAPTGSDLAAETALLEQARAALQGGSAKRALAIADEHARRHVRGQLREERERLAIEALVAQGRIDAARERAKRFDQAFPNSVQSERIHALIRRR